MHVKNSIFLGMQRLSPRTKKWGFVFCSHELQLEPQRNRLKTREKQAGPLKDEIYYFVTISIAFGLVSMGTCFCSRGGQ